MTKTLTGNENALVGVTLAVMGAINFHLRILSDWPKSADVIGQDGQVIGSAHRIYSDGWAVHTKPYAGYVPDSQIVMLEN